MHRRRFLRNCGAVCGYALVARAADPLAGPSEDELRKRIEEQRPSRLGSKLSGMRDRVGAAHVAGRYHLTDKPFLLEGAAKLLELGTRVGKFWFIPDSIARSYPFNSQWGQYRTFVDLARSEYFAALFAMPFTTLLLEAHTPVENGWLNHDRDPEFYRAVEREFYDLTAHLYQRYGDRNLTIVLQHWEGDWLLRGRGGELWDPPPADWQQRCARMVRWLAARQAGVTAARREFAKGRRCIVAHAAEVNRVMDAAKGIPTMTRHVLPHVELDLVSYSCYDGMKDPLTLWRSLAEIRRYARPTSLFGADCVYVGEIGIPENERAEDLTERWDQWMGVLNAAGVRYVAHWELYCNEARGKDPPPAPEPITDPKQLRGFWLVRPDGALSVAGRFFAGLWRDHP